MLSNNERSADFEVTLRGALRQALMGAYVACPAIIVSVDLAKMTVSAQPAIRGILVDKAKGAVAQDLPVLQDLPLMFQGGGGITLTLPVAAGDECLIVFADRCIDAWWQSGGVQMPMDARAHDLSDGFAIVGLRSLPRAISGISSTAAQLRTDDGGTSISVSSGVVKIKSVSVEIEGDLTVKGATEFKGPVKANGKPIDETHTHGGVRTGTGTSGGVV